MSREWEAVCARCGHARGHHANKRTGIGKQPCHKRGAHDMRCPCRDYLRQRLAGEEESTAPAVAAACHPAVAGLVQHTRAVLAVLPAGLRCHPTCPGWIVVDMGHVEVCDECAAGRKEVAARWSSKTSVALGDDDVALLPEAQAALTEESGDALRCALDTCEEEHPPIGHGLIPVTCPACCVVLGLPAADKAGL